MFNTSGINTILWRFLVMIITGGVVRGQTTPGPNAVAFLKGQTMLDCSMHAVDTSMWSRTTDGTNNLVHITTSCLVVGNNSAHYRTEQPGNNICRLIIANATMQQSGVYECYAGLGGTLYRSLVTVVDPSASIIVYNQSKVVENDQLNISCSISYNGATSPAPSLRPSPYWITSSEQDFTSETYHSSANIVTSVATVRVQRPTVPLFHCNTMFEITGNTIGFNATPPHDNVTFGSTAELDVQYRPDVPDITIEYQIVEIGGIPCEVGVLTCNSTGNPQPSYVWRDTKENGNITKVATFDLAEIDRNYTCVAENMIRNTSYKAMSFHVQKSLTNVENCRFPRDESVRHDVTGCDNGTCSCSNGYDGINLTCNAESYPNASFQWVGPDEIVIYSKFYTNITKNGLYRCTSYFERSMTNYTGNVVFANGSSEANVSECCAVVDLVMSVVIPFLIKCLIFLVVFIVCLNLQKEFRVAMTKRFNWLKKLQHRPSSVNGHVDLPATKNKTSSGAELALCICFVIGSLAIGLFVIPVLITIAFCSSSVEDDAPDLEMRDNQKQMEEDDKSKNHAMTHQSGAGGTRDSKSKWILVLMWCLTVVALVPVAFIVVFFAFCNQMRYAIV